MMAKIITKCKRSAIPANVYTKAVKLMKAYNGGNHTLAHRSKKCSHCVIPVGLKWRLLDRKGDGEFELMSHERYNREVLRW